MKKPSAKRAAAMRRAFQCQFGKPGPLYDERRIVWTAFQAGAAWQRRQKGRQ